MTFFPRWQKPRVSLKFPENHKPRAMKRDIFWRFSLLILIEQGKTGSSLTCSQSRQKIPFFFLKTSAFQRSPPIKELRWIHDARVLHAFIPWELGGHVLKITTFARLGAVFGILFWVNGCLAPGGPIPAPSSSSAPTGTSTSSSSTVSPIRGIQFVFSTSSTQGSFNAPSSGGTNPGTGILAVRAFNPDGSILNGGIGGLSWLSSFAVTVSGSNNSNATNSACATFASTAESTSANCNFGSGPTQCGAPSGFYRVSEWDCVQSPAAALGNGSSTDGISMWAEFTRANLLPTDNVMAVLKYSASALDPAPASPISCFNAGVFSPEYCSDFTWEMYLKHSFGEVDQPFMLIVPPTLAAVLATHTSGSGVTAKQFYLPLASDANLSVMQISRTGATLTPSTTSFQSTCNAGGTGNSPLCAGMVFYSITFYRI